jgi:hypothetical protein
MFCQNCGAQVMETFCTKCGTRASQPSPSPSLQYAPPPQYPQPLPPAAKSGSGLKILIVVLGVLGLLGVLAIGGIWFAVHKVKQAAANNGIDLHSFSETRGGPARPFDACELLTKEDLSQILNLSVERAEGDGKSTHSTCRYYSSGAQQRSLDEAAAAQKRLEEDTKDGNSKPDPSSVINDFGNLVRGAAGAAAPAVGQTDGLVLLPPCHRASRLLTTAAASSPHCPADPAFLRMNSASSCVIRLGNPRGRRHRVGAWPRRAPRPTRIAAQA